MKSALVLFFESREVCDEVGKELLNTGLPFEIDPSNNPTKYGEYPAEKFQGMEPLIMLFDSPEIHEAFVNLVIEAHPTLGKICISSQP